LGANATFLVDFAGYSRIASLGQPVFLFWEQQSVAVFPTDAVQRSPGQNFDIDGVGDLFDLRQSIFVLWLAVGVDVVEYRFGDHRHDSS
jgi:hypothetical protein